VIGWGNIACVRHSSDMDRASSRLLRGFGCEDFGGSDLASEMVSIGEAAQRDKYISAQRQAKQRNVFQRQMSIQIPPSDYIMPQKITVDC